jgi:hypothetical protein
VKPRFAGLKLLALFFLTCVCYPAPVFAWGCRGHQTVALIAERHLRPEARQYLESLLQDNPIDAQLYRYCGNFKGSLFADSSTWPDDVRNILKNGTWHYINIPRGAPRGPLEPYCADSGCVTKAIADELAILKDPHLDARKRADALRYLIHFIADLHMPLHAITNNDQGGNCVPVQYFWRLPQEHNHTYTPNLHSLWDTSIVERDMEGADPREYSDFLDKSFAREVEAWQNAGIRVDDWAWESYELAQSVAYAKLRPQDPTEKPLAVDACSDDHDVGDRLLKMRFAVAEKYQRAAASVVEKRLAQAGIRLAMVLNDAAKAAQSTKNTAAPPNLPLALLSMSLPFCGSTPIARKDRALPSASAPECSSRNTQRRPPPALPSGQAPCASLPCGVNYALDRLGPLACPT